MEIAVAIFILTSLVGLVVVRVTRLEQRQRKAESQLAVFAEVLGRATPELGRKIEENSTRVVFNESSWGELQDEYSEGKDWSV